MTIGNAWIWLSGILAAVAFISAAGWARGRAGWEKIFRPAYAGMTVALFAACLLLLRAILTHDFRYDYVAQYSSRDLPFLYLLSAFWGGQEGTFLLWAFFAALLGIPLMLRRSWRPASVMAAYTPTIGLLIAFMLTRNGNPFRLAAQVPADGEGLNPLLQDPWMAIHPPVVFLGYAAVTVPGVLAWVSAFHQDHKSWAPTALRYAIFGFLTLGAGIIMGGVWAYKVLGWGGFWGWDPVENASLIPWIVSAALIHGILVQQSTGALRRTNLILAMAGYLLIMYSTFLTRSGVLADFSVHSFPKGTIYGWLVAGLILILVTSLISLFRRRIPEGAPIDSKLSWPLVLTVTIVLLAISALLVLVGTSWPILSSAVGKPATVTASFYNQVSRPVYLLLLAILGIAPFLAWAPLPRGIWLRRLLLSASAAAAGTILAAVLGGRGVWPLAIFFTALLALFSNLIRLVEVLPRRPLATGAAVTHIGFALLFLGIIASESWDRTQHLSLPLGQPVTAFGRTLTYRGQVEGSSPKLRWRVAVAEPGRPPADVQVVMYERPGNELYKKPAILRHAGMDLYLAPVNVESAEQPEQAERPVPAGGPEIVLSKGQPVEVRGASLVFQSFQNAGRRHERHDAGQRDRGGLEGRPVGDGDAAAHGRERADDPDSRRRGSAFRSDAHLGRDVGRGRVDPSLGVGRKRRDGGRQLRIRRRVQFRVRRRARFGERTGRGVGARRLVRRVRRGRLVRFSRIAGPRRQREAAHRPGLGRDHSSFARLRPRFHAPDAGAEGRRGWPDRSPSGMIARRR